MSLETAVDEVIKLSAEVRRLHAENERLWALAEFGKWCFDAHRENFTDLDGGDLQESAESFGLIKAIEVTERCDADDCQCEHYGDFPAQCYRSTPRAQLPEKRE